MTESPQFKLGAKPAKRDARNFKMKELLLVPKRPPRTYNFDAKYTADIPFPMWANDQHGDCVVVGTAAQLQRMELVEQKRLVNIPEKDVLAQYYRETGGPDEGLYILNHLGVWRREGMAFCGQKYKILAFAEIDRSNITEVKATASSQIGLQIGLALPDNWGQQFNKGKWTDCSQPPNEFNGHCVHAGFSYDSRYLYCHTWAKKIPMSWKFFSKYCSEAYGVIDATNEWAVDVAALADMLRKVSPA